MGIDFLEYMRDDLTLLKNPASRELDNFVTLFPFPLPSKLVSSIHQ